MDGRRAELATTSAAPVVNQRRLDRSRARRSDDTTSESRGRLPLRWSLALLAGWVATFALIAALEPAVAPETTTPEPVLELLQLIASLAIMSTALLILLRNRLATGSSLVASVAALGAHVGCIALGHATLSTTLWQQQFAIIASISILSAVAQRRQGL